MVILEVTINFKLGHSNPMWEMPIRLFEFWLIIIGGTADVEYLYIDDVRIVLTEPTASIKDNAAEATRIYLMATPSNWCWRVMDLGLARSNHASRI